MYRVDKILKDPWYNECLKRNAQAEKNRIFCRHDLDHMLNVARITYMLILESLDTVAATGKPGDPIKSKEVIYAAGLLHDMARWQEYETGEDHAVVSARMAELVLDRAGFNCTEKEVIVAAIHEHRTGGPDASPLGQYICRADDLARPCSRCNAKADCYKFKRMETAEMLMY